MRLSQTTGSVTTCLSNSIESVGSADRKPGARPPLPLLLRARARAAKCRTAQDSPNSQDVIAVCAAAVADWHVKDAGTAKLKKQDGGPPPPIELAENPDILRRLSSHEARPDLVVGFAAETGNLRENAAAKLTRKGCDWIVANDVGGGSVFDSDSNSALLLTGKETEEWPQMPKSELAARLVDRIGEHFA